MIRSRRLLIVCILAVTVAAGTARGQGFAPPPQPAQATPAAGAEAAGARPADELLPLDRHTFDPPIPASIRKSSGTVLRGLWLAIEPDGIRFQTEQGSAFTYENKSVRSIRTLDGKVTYNPGKDEVEQAVAASRLAYPKIVRPAPDAGSGPAATTIPGRNPIPAPPGFPRPFGGAAPFGGNPFPTGGNPFPAGSAGGAPQAPSNAQQMLQNSQNRAQQQMADMHRRQQESASAAQQQANRAFEQLREQLDASPRPRWEGGRQIVEYEYRCRHCGHAFNSTDPSLGGTPCPRCHPTQARPGALAGAAGDSSGGSSWSSFRLSRGIGKLAVAAVSGLALLGGAVFAAARSGGHRSKRRKRRAKSDEYEDY